MSDVAFPVVRRGNPFGTAGHPLGLDFLMYPMSRPTGLMFYLDYINNIPTGEIFLPSEVVCDQEYCIYGTNVAHNCPCRKCGGTGYI